MNNTYQKGEYIVTKDGFRGYVVKKLDYASSLYEIRLASGYAVYSSQDFEKDSLMKNI